MHAAGKLLRRKEPALWFEPALVLGLAAALDFVVGDPWSWPHPVQFMGWIIAGCQHLALRLASPVLQRLAGIALTLGLISLSGFMAWVLVALASSLHPGLGVIVQVGLLSSCFAGRSLRDAAEDVLKPLEKNEIVTARGQLSRYVGRDTHDLDRSGILRAVLETVSENATDGVTAPLFYAAVGGFVGGQAMAPVAALSYKAASTLDSMLGYRKEPFEDLGWFGARLEDGLTWLPCRLTVFTIALLSGFPVRVWKVCLRDARFDPSPNSGWSECAFAAALGVRLGGCNYYQGIARVKPHLGDNLQPITPERVRTALAIIRKVFLLWLGVFLAMFIGVQAILR